MPLVFVTRVWPTLRSVYMEGALMTYHSFRSKGLMIFFPFPFFPFDKRLFFLRRKHGGAACSLNERAKYHDDKRAHAEQQSSNRKRHDTERLE